MLLVGLGGPGAVLPLSPSAPGSVSVSVPVARSGQSEGKSGETASHAAAKAKPHGKEKSGKETKETKDGGSGQAPDTRQVDEWGEDSSQEAEMVEVAEGVLKRPSQESEGDGTPVRRRKPGTGASARGLQEAADESEDDVLLVDASEGAESTAGPAPGEVEPQGGPPPEPPEPPDGRSGKALLPGFSEVLGAAK